MSDTNHNRGAPRLLFTQEERDNPKLERKIEKAEKAGEKAASAQEKTENASTAGFLQNRSTRRKTRRRCYRTGSCKTFC